MVDATVSAIGEILYASPMISNTSTDKGEKAKDLETHTAFVRVAERIVGWISRML